MPSCHGPAENPPELNPYCGLSLGFQKQWSCVNRYFQLRKISELTHTFIGQNLEKAGLFVHLEISPPNDRFLCPDKEGKKDQGENGQNDQGREQERHVELAAGDQDDVSEAVLPADESPPPYP